MHISETDLASEAEWLPLVEAVSVIEVIAPGRARDWPVVVPVHACWDGNRFLCHFSRRNPIWEALEESRTAMVSLHGAWAYIRGRWKAMPGTPETFGVPTSYYWAVQMLCDAEVVDDLDDLAGLLRTLIARFEGSAEALADPAKVHRDRLGLIRGLRLTPSEVRAKIKVGNNQPFEIQRRVRDELAGRGDPADLMLVPLIDARRSATKVQSTDS